MYIYISARAPAISIFLKTQARRDPVLVLLVFASYVCTQRVHNSTHIKGRQELGPFAHIV